VAPSHPASPFRTQNREHIETGRTRLPLLALLVLERILDVGDGTAHLVQIMGAVRLGGAAGENRTGVFHHLDMVFVGGAPGRGDCGEWAARVATRPGGRMDGRETQAVCPSSDA
jgi:hypothetical protein